MRSFSSAVLALALIAAGPSAGAQQPYPTRPITVVVPFAAGGPTDVMTRILGQHMSQTLGQQIVVENVTGGGGSIGAARVAKAAPDGYTMVMGNLGTHAAAVGLYKNLSYDPRVDFEPVMLVASTPMALIVRKTFPAGTLKDLTAYAAQAHFRQRRHRLDLAPHLSALHASHEHADRARALSRQLAVDE
jgi:tripartite-type tricarboxylate transporter receptor subunit TctC